MNESIGKIRVAKEAVCSRFIFRKLAARFLKLEVPYDLSHRPKTSERLLHYHIMFDRDEDFRFVFSFALFYFTISFHRKSSSRVAQLPRQRSRDSFTHEGQARGVMKLVRTMCVQSVHGKPRRGVEHGRARWLRAFAWLIVDVRAHPPNSV